MDKGYLVVAKRNKVGSLYVFESHAEVGLALMVEDNAMELWHKRLKHMNKRGIEVMLKRE